MLELISMEESINWLPIAVGAVVSFVCALIVIHFFWRSFVNIRCGRLFGTVLSSQV
ncbi:MAG: hypothetical protein R3B53_02290 [Candidatus Paceibacterota bacterium]